jgi:hypothetical protein
VLFLHCQNFLGRKYDNKYSIFGCEYVTLNICQTACRNCSIFVGSYSALKKESIAHFPGFLANWGACQNFGAQNGKY